MAYYTISWKDYCLPTGEEFAVAVCGYNGKVRHLTIGRDPMRQMLANQVNVDGTNCSASLHCIALDCPLNHTKHEHLMHLLDMYSDEPVDATTAKLWGKTTAVECMVEMARHVTESLAMETLQRKPPTSGGEG